jgi:hypothetical protein
MPSDFKIGGLSLSKKSCWDFFDRLHNASIFRLLQHPENLPRCGAKGSVAGVLQAFDFKRGGAAPSHSPAKTGGVCLCVKVFQQAGQFMRGERQFRGKMQEYGKFHLTAQIICGIP